MNNFLERISRLSPKRLALLALDLQTKLEAAERQKPEPIAIIGMACRFPGGANSPAEFWQLLTEGRDAITEIPPSRWPVEAYYDPDPDAPGKITTRWGGFIDDFDRFDPQFFGISPREARSMDPQQRLVLEVGWEALERSGYAPDKLAGSKTGVFIGICNNDYYQLLTSAGGDQLDTYTATGGAHSVVSGRFSYVLGLQGPSLSVDTACSSSLVAIHLAVQSLRQGECQMAVAGGVNVLAAVEVTIALSKGHMMASDGRCKAFDAAADGFVRSEGCGMVVLKRLSQAQADGDNILAVIRGSAINQDGRSNGLTAPNGPSQEAVIREALANAGVEPHQVTYVETHGTGTSLGDPIEAQALGAALGRGRAADKPLAIGSVKTNIGHLESAAGVAGLIKLVLTLQHGEIPPHLHLHELNPYIPWADLPLTIPTRRTEWTVENGSRIGGVSSFGFSGTNTHIIVEEAPKPAPRAQGQNSDRPLHLLTLSAKSEAALAMLATRFEQHLAAQPAEALADICYTANVGRAHFNHRLAVIAEETEQVRDTLAAWRQGQAPKELVSRQIQGPGQPDVVFLFTGQGSQYVTMGRKLYETQPVFRRVLDKCDELLRPYLDQSLLKVIYPEPGQASPLDETLYTQPALFALEYALAELWRSWGIEPAVVMGHSVGEYVAACVAGVFSLEDGLKLVAERARLMQSVATQQQGEMAAVFAAEAQMTAALAPYTDRVSIASVNGPEQVVISGEKSAVQAVLDELKAQGIRGRRLAVSIAGHSPLMEPILDQFGQIAAGVTYATPKIGIISGVTGRLISGRDIATPDYWRQHIREAVQFFGAIKTAYEQGYKLFLEIGPTPTLLEMGQRCLPQDAGIWLPSLRPKHDDWQQLLTSLGNLYVQGVPVDWAGFEQAYAQNRRRLSLPTYPFEKDRYWASSIRPGQSRLIGQPRPVQGHPLLGQPLRSPAIQDWIFETQLGASWPPFLDHHRVYGMAIVPSPAFIEMALRAAEESMGPGLYEVTDFAIHEALILPEEGLKTVQLILNDQAQFQIVSLEGEANWKTHVVGKVQRSSNAASITPDPFDVEIRSFPQFAIEAVQNRCPEEISGEVYYQQLGGLGLEFGSAFQGITRVWRRDGEALGLVQLPEMLATEADQYHIHPAFLDACFHLLGAPLAHEIEMAYLLIGIDRFRLYRAPGSQLWNHTVLQSDDRLNKDIFSAHIRLFDQSGELVAEIEGLHLKRASREALLQATRRRADDWLYQVQWQAKPPALVLGPDYLPAPQQLAAQVDPHFAVLSQQSDLALYQRLAPQSEAMCAAYIVKALRQLGWAFHLGESVSVDSLSTCLGVVAPHRRLLGRILAILAEDGFLRQTASGWDVVAVPSPADPDILLSELVARYPAYEAELTLTGRCGAALAGVLVGTQDPLQLLFPTGSLDMTEKLYQDSPFAQVYNTLVQQTLLAALAGLPEDRTVRILEIGAGTGATTSYLLPNLPTGRTEYRFTDLSPLFTSRAAEKFKDYSFVQYSLLDIERDPAGQGLADQRFDLILAANVLHATADLRQTLAHTKQLLAPNGLLILLEGAKPQRWVDLTFGLTEGWWKFSDADIRPDYPLLPPQQWLALLRKMGFAAVVTIPTTQEEDVLPEQMVVLAQLSQARPTATEPAGSWLIFTDRQGVGQALAQQLEQRGDRCRFVWPGQQYLALAEGWQVDPTQPEDFRRLVNEALIAQPSCHGVIHLWSLDAVSAAQLTLSALEGEQQLNCGSVLHLVQALAQTEAIKSLPLWLATSGAQPLGSETEAVAIDQTPLWGLGRVIALEYPELWGGLIDLDPAIGPAENAKNLAAELSQTDGEDQITWRAGQRYIARLVRTPNLKPQPVSYHADGAYLITGGLGGLGLKVAYWLAEQGARYLVLIGRRGLPERNSWTALAPDSEVGRQIAAIQAIEALGATVVVESADVGDLSRMQALFKQFGHTAPPLRGIIHAAAALSAWSLKEMPLSALLDMLKPKVAGTWILHQLTQGMKLDFFGLFSSTTALWGSSKLGHYAAANQFLDGFAHYRRALGLPAVSLNWGTWDEMRVASVAEQQMAAQTGLNRMPAEQALAYLGDFLGGATPQVVIASVDWAILKAAYEVKRQRPFLQHLEEQTVEIKRNGTAPKQSVAEPSELLRQWTVARPDQRQDILISHIQREVARVLGLDPVQAIDLHQGLFEMGLDSLMSVELKSRLETCIAQSLPSTLIFNYPTIADLAHYLDTVLKPAPTELSKEPPLVQPLPAKNELSLASENGAAQSDSDDLSEDELATLLLKKLEQLQ